jgi:hypothetical protein
MGQTILTVEAAVTTTDVVHGSWACLWVASYSCAPETVLKAAVLHPA